jgi:hypothetical protein
MTEHYLSQSLNLKWIALRAKFEACKLYDVVCLILCGMVRVFYDMLGCTSHMHPVVTTHFTPIRWPAHDA